MKTWIKRSRNAKGFTLIELLVVVLIIGILAAIAIPQYFKVVEKGKAAEALSWINDFRGAQQRYLLSNNGNFNTGTTGYDITLATLKNFVQPGAANIGVVNGNNPYWTLTLARVVTPAAPAFYGAYSVAVTGSNGSIICLGTQASCQPDLMP